MSSDLVSALKFYFMDDCLALVIVVTVTYDYVLTFSREVEYIWCRSWGWVSTIFVLVRYLGLGLSIIAALVGTFVSAPVDICTALYLVAVWGYPIYLAAGDLVMIMRVYAMWN